MFLQKLIVKTRRFFRRTEGASAIEYALIVAMVALVVIVFVPQISGSITGTFTKVAEGLAEQLPAAPADPD
ncbi:Flp family type IVb pilin [Pseudomonas sp. IT-P176]|uniref:Flp family type IVb pilin n=1 Tax=Pseudomonas sp. IT-P176 TaxID=3026444 RepID=UPI0039E1F2E9